MLPTPPKKPLGFFPLRSPETTQKYVGNSEESVFVWCFWAFPRRKKKSQKVKCKKTPKTQKQKIKPKNKLCPKTELVTKTGETVGLAGKLGLGSSYAWVHTHRVRAALYPATRTYHPCGCGSAGPWAVWRRTYMHLFMGLNWIYIPQVLRTFQATLRSMVGGCLRLSSSL